MSTVTLKNAQGRVLEEWPINFGGDHEPSDSNPFRVRHLIEKLARESVRDFELRQKEAKFAFLTTERLQTSVEKGKIGRAYEEIQEVDVEDAVGNALQAFEDKLFLLFVDRSEKRDLDDIVVLKPETKIVLIKLTALAGM